MKVVLQKPSRWEFIMTHQIGSGFFFSPASKQGSDLKVIGCNTVCGEPSRRVARCFPLHASGSVKLAKPPKKVILGDKTAPKQTLSNLHAKKRLTITILNYHNQKDHFPRRRARPDGHPTTPSDID